MVDYNNADANNANHANANHTNVASDVTTQAKCWPLTYQDTLKLYNNNIQQQKRHEMWIKFFIYCNVISLTDMIFPLGFSKIFAEREEVE